MRITTLALLLLSACTQAVAPQYHETWDQAACSDGLLHCDGAPTCPGFLAPSCQDGLAVCVDDDGLTAPGEWPVRCAPGDADSQL